MISSYQQYGRDRQLNRATMTDLLGATVVPLFLESSARPTIPFPWARQAPRLRLGWSRRTASVLLGYVQERERERSEEEIIARPRPSPSAGPQPPRTDKTGCWGAHTHHRRGAPAISSPENSPETNPFPFFCVPTPPTKNPARANNSSIAVATSRCPSASDPETRCRR